MGDDDAEDLDAFFDEVEEKVAEVVKDEASADFLASNEALQPQPPAKRQKKSDDTTTTTTTTTQLSSPPPARPRGVVVAAASSYKAVATGAASSYKEEGVMVRPFEPEGGASVTTVVIGPSLSHPAAPRHTERQQSNYATASAAAMNPLQANHHHMGSSYPEAMSTPVTVDLMGPFVTTQTPNQKPSEKPHIRTAGGKTWVDSSLDEWPDDDFRIFVGNLGPEVSDLALFQHFVKYSSVLRAKIVRDAKKGESKGYGFVSFADALDCAKAIREMDQTWLGSRPIRIKRSSWKDREIQQVRKKARTNKNHQKKMGLL